MKYVNSFLSFFKTNRIKSFTFSFIFALCLFCTNLNAFASPVISRPSWGDAPFYVCFYSSLGGSSNSAYAQYYEWSNPDYVLKYDSSQGRLFFFSKATGSLVPSLIDVYQNTFNIDANHDITSSDWIQYKPSLWDDPGRKSLCSGNGGIYGVGINSINGNSPITYYDGSSLFAPITTNNANYTKYQSRSYEGLLITNPFDGATLKTSATTITAHARIKAKFVLDTALNNTIIANVPVVNNSVHDQRSNVIDYATSHLSLFLDNVFYDVVPTVSYDDVVDAGYYNLTITFSVNLTNPSTVILLKDSFIDGVLGDALLGSNVIDYGNSVTYKYIAFVPVVTSSTNGNVVTKTTTQPSGVSIVDTTTTNSDGSTTNITTHDGYTDTTNVDPNGVVTKSTNQPPVVDSSNSSSLGFFGSLLKFLGQIVSFLLYPLTAILGLLTSLLASLKDVVISFGDVVPFLTNIFGFLPAPVIGLITACFGFLAIGVFLRTFGRK